MDKDSTLSAKSDDHSDGKVNTISICDQRVT